MPEAELEGGIGDVGTGMREQALAHGIEPDVAQQVHRRHAILLVAQRIERAHAHAGRTGQVGQRQRRAQAAADVALQHVQALQLPAPTRLSADSLAAR